MTIRHLKIFLTVAETGKMSMAAEQLYITQPSVSQAIRELEDHTTRYCSLNASPKNFISLKTEKSFMSRPNSL